LSELKFRVSKYRDGDDTPAVYAELSGPGIVGSKQLVLSAGVNESWHTEKVRPGQFLVQATLPSGDVFSREIDVPDAEGNSVVEVRISPEASSYESFGWPQLFGGQHIHGLAARFDPRRLPSLGAARVDLMFAMADRWHVVPLAQGPLSEEHIRIGQQGTVASMPSQRYLVWHDRNQEDIVIRFIPTNDSPPAPTCEGRAFIKVFGAGRPKTGLIASLPLPWYALRENGHAALRVDVLVSQSGAKNRSRINMAVLVRDELVAPMLGYLQHGQLRALRTIGDHFLADAEQLLNRKVVNPYAAAVGALILLRTGEYERLHDWPANLANWFPWLPDGAVIWGWSCLLGLGNRTKAKPDVTAARAAFLEAAKRGVPVFTEYLRLLVDGLKRCRAGSNEDPEINSALTRMRRYAVSSNPHLPLTVFRGEHPLEPK